MPRERIDEDIHKLRSTRPQWKDHEPGASKLGRPKKPDGLSVRAADRWDYMVKLLRKRRILTADSAPILELYCEQWARTKLLLDAVGSNVQIETADGPAPNPLLKEIAKLENSQRALLQQMAATPVSRERARPTAPVQPKVDEEIAAGEAMLRR